jgi:hypothetical protein
MMIEALALAAVAVVPTLQPKAEVTGCQWLSLIYWPGGGASRATTGRSAQAAPNLNRRVHFEDQATQESATGSGREACRLRITSLNVAPRRVAVRALEGSSRVHHGLTMGWPIETDK